MLEEIKVCLDCCHIFKIRKEAINKVRQCPRCTGTCLLTLRDIEALASVVNDTTPIQDFAVGLQTVRERQGITGQPLKTINRVLNLIQIVENFKKGASRGQL